MYTCTYMHSHIYEYTYIYACIQHRHTHTTKISGSCGSSVPLQAGKEFWSRAWVSPLTLMSLSFSSCKNLVHIAGSEGVGHSACSQLSMESILQAADLFLRPGWHKLCSSSGRSHFKSLCALPSCPPVSGTEAGKSSQIDCAQISPSFLHFCLLDPHPPLPGELTHCGASSPRG